MTPSKPQVFVTGLSGLVGSRFNKLYSDHYDFINLDLTAGVDITNREQVLEVVKGSDAQSIIHLAAYTNVSEAANQQDDKNGVCYKVNVLGAQNIAQVAQELHKYLIHISTDYVFDGEKDSPYTEDDQPNPIEWYGQTKLWAEEEVHKSQANNVILRLAFPYQAHPQRPDFMAKMMENLKQNRLPPAFTDHVLTPTFVDDVAQVFDYCLRNRPTGLYHMVGSSSHTDYELAQMVKEVFALPGEVKPGSLKAYIETTKRPYQKNMRVSNNKLQQAFGIRMNNFKDGIEQVRKQMVA